MKHVFTFLKSLLKHTQNAAKRVPRSALVSFIRQDASIFCRRVARKFRITVRGVEYSIEKLTEEDQHIVEVIIDCSTRLVQNYLEDHEEYTDERAREEDIENLLMSHASEIFEAGKSAVISQFGSHWYNEAFGKPDTSQTLFTNDNVIKTATISAINATMAEIDDLVDHIQRSH